MRLSWREPPLHSAPATYWQERYALAYGGIDSNVAVALRASTPLDRGALAVTLENLVARHEALRTTLGICDGEVEQFVWPPHTCEVKELNVRRSRRLSSDELDVVLASIADTPLQLIGGQLMEATVLTVDGSEYVVLSLHHAIMDGWSCEILVREFRAFYDSIVAGTACPLPEIAMQVRDFARNERIGVPDKVYRYWQERLDLARMPSRPSLLADHEARCGWRFSSSSSVPPSDATTLRDVALADRVTFFMVLLAGVAVSLRRQGLQQVVLGMIHPNRHSVEARRVIGFLADSLPIIVTTGPNMTFREVLVHVRTAVLGAWSHRVPIWGLVEAMSGGGVGETRYPNHVEVNYFPQRMLETAPQPDCLRASERFSERAIPFARRRFAFDVRVRLAPYGCVIQHNDQGGLDILTGTNDAGIPSVALEQLGAAVAEELSDAARGFR